MLCSTASYGSVVESTLQSRHASSRFARNLVNGNIDFQAQPVHDGTISMMTKVRRSVNQASLVILWKTFTLHEEEVANACLVNFILIANDAVGFPTILQLPEVYVRLLQILCANAIVRHDCSADVVVDVPLATVVLANNLQLHEKTLHEWKQLLQPLTDSTRVLRDTLLELHGQRQGSQQSVGDLPEVCAMSSLSLDCFKGAVLQVQQAAASQPVYHRLEALRADWAVHSHTLEASDRKQLPLRKTFAGEDTALGRR